MIGNEFVAPQPSQTNKVFAEPLQPAVMMPAFSASSTVGQAALTGFQDGGGGSWQQRFRNGWHKTRDYGLFVLLVAVIISGTILVWPHASYLISQLDVKVSAPAFEQKISPAQPYITVSNNLLAGKLNAIENQKITIDISGHMVNVSSATIKGWLTTKPQSSLTNIMVDEDRITSYLADLRDKFTTAPVTQVAATHNGVSTIIAAGIDGSAPTGLTSLAGTIGNKLLGSQGMALTSPIKPVVFATVAPSDYSKLIEVNLTTQTMYTYQGGSIINTFPVSSGRSGHSTPTGTFHIWTKLTSQTMIGPGYVQPDVPWVNYFDHNGDAIHGVYWRPASVFGHDPTSHGCVGLPVDDALWVYDWAPIGTTVVIHY